MFSASIPSWTQTTLEGDELVVVSFAQLKRGDTRGKKQLETHAWHPGSNQRNVVGRVLQALLVESHLSRDPLGSVSAVFMDQCVSITAVLASYGQQLLFQSQDCEGEGLTRIVRLLQFYRVEVKVLPPDKNGAPRCRSVLRRFSHFKKLHGRVSHLCTGSCHSCQAAHTFNVSQPGCTNFRLLNSLVPHLQAR